MTVFSYEETESDNPLGGISPADVDRIPFGAVELDRDGRVVSYNDTEPDDGAPAKSEMIGRSLFDDVLRWASGSVIAQEFAKGVASGELNVVFDCGVARVPYKVRMHLKVSPILGTFWIFIKKLRRQAA